MFQDRTYGVSKMNKGIVKEGILGVLILRWHSLFTNYRKRVTNTDAITMTPVHKNEMVAEGK